MYIPQNIQCSLEHSRRNISPSLPIKSYSSFGFPSNPIHPLGSKLNISNTCNLKSSSNPPVRKKLISTILLEYYESIFTIGLITIHLKIPHFFC